VLFDYLQDKPFHQQVNELNVMVLRAQWTCLLCSVEGLTMCLADP
jgi:hypothetical protein